ncbi:hypothetical protein GCM10009076_15800 [Erythrobacter ramosus]
MNLPPPKTEKADETGRGREAGAVEKHGCRKRRLQWAEPAHVCGGRIRKRAERKHRARCDRAPTARRSQPAGCLPNCRDDDASTYVKWGLTANRFDDAGPFAFTGPGSVCVTQM